MLRRAERELLTVREVAEVLRCSPVTVRRRIAAEELPAVRTGTGPRTPLRVKATTLAEFIYREAGDAVTSDR